MSNFSAATSATTTTNRMLLSGSSLNNAKKRTSVSKIEELVEPISSQQSFSEKSSINLESSKTFQNSENSSTNATNDRRQLQKRSSDLLKAKNYLKAQLKLQESNSAHEDTPASVSSQTQPISRLRSNSFLLGKNSAEFNSLLVSFEGAASNQTAGSMGPEASSIPKSEHFRQQHQPTTLKSSLVSSAQASFTRPPNKKTSNENLKSSISKIARQKSGDQIRTLPLSDSKHFNKDNSSTHKKEGPSSPNILAYNTSSSSSSSACAYSHIGIENMTPPPQKMSPVPPVTPIPNQETSSDQQTYNNPNNNNRKELLLIPSDKLAEYISRSICKYQTNENNSVVDQMASFIDELKDFIDDRLIDTTSQLEMSNRHVYHLYKSVNYLIKEVSSLKIQNEELKQELFIMNSKLKAKHSIQQPTIISHATPICCYASLKKNAPTTAGIGKPNEYLLIESNSPSDEPDLSRLSEFSGGENSNETTNGRNFYESMYNDDEARNINYLTGWQRQKSSEGPLSTGKTTTGVNSNQNVMSSSPYFEVTKTETVPSDVELNSSSPNSNNNNNNNNNNNINVNTNSNHSNIRGDRFVSAEDNLDNVKLNKLLNCEIDYFKNSNAKSAGVSPRKASNDGFKIIDQLLAAKGIEKYPSATTGASLSATPAATATPESTVSGAKNTDTAASKRAREILSKSSIIHHLHTSLAPFTSLINDFDTHYSWDYTD